MSLKNFPVCHPAAYSASDAQRGVHRSSQYVEKRKRALQE